MDGAQQKVLLEWLLDYELKLAARFRYYVALVYVKPFDNTANEHIIEDLFQRDKRDCDQYFQLEDRNAILMAHTSLDEAKKAIDHKVYIGIDLISLIIILVVQWFALEKSIIFPMCNPRLVAEVIKRREFYVFNENMVQSEFMLFRIGDNQPITNCECPNYSS